VLDEDNMARRVDASRGDVVAAISAMVRWVAQEDTRDGPGCELVCSRRRGVGVAEAAEHPELVVAWWHTEKQLVRRDGAGGATWTPVEQIRGRVQSFCPKLKRSCTVN